jgi:hypothetical protein
MAEIIIIEPGRPERNYWVDLWRYRGLFRVLAWRDLAVRYKQTIIGAAWAVIRPFLTMSQHGKKFCRPYLISIGDQPGRHCYSFVIEPG